MGFGYCKYYRTCLHSGWTQEEKEEKGSKAASFPETMALQADLLIKAIS